MFTSNWMSSIKAFDNLSGVSSIKDTISYGVWEASRELLAGNHYVCKICSIVEWFEDKVLPYLVFLLTRLPNFALDFPIVTEV